MTEADDQSLVQDAQGGDRRAFAMLVERHYRFMFKAAWQWCGVKEDAEDIAQEAAVKLAQHIDAFKGDAAFTTWLYRLVINTAKDYYKAKNRRNMREQPLFEDAVYISSEPSPEQKLEQKDVLKALNELPGTLKEAVILVCWRGMTHREAADVLECSEGTISWRIHEARKKMAEYIDIQKKVKRHG